MIDKATCLVEICFVLETRTKEIASQIELTWLTSYLLHYKTIEDRKKDPLSNSNQ